jgi:hypothetical protein
VLERKGNRPAAIVGERATDNDAARLARSRAPVKQITSVVTKIDLAKAVEFDRIAARSHIQAVPPGKCVCSNFRQKSGKQWTSGWRLTTVTVTPSDIYATKGLSLDSN